MCFAASGDRASSILNAAAKEGREGGREAEIERDASQLFSEYSCEGRAGGRKRVRGKERERCVAAVFKKA
jgi:hypothetical protein